MVILIALVGVLVGWFLNWLADYLPRYSATCPAAATRTRLCAPAVWQLLRSPWQRTAVADRAFALCLGVELLSAVSFAFFWSQPGPSWKLLFNAAVYAFFLLIAIIDLKYRLVLNIVTYPATAAVLLIQLVVLRQNAGNVLLGGGLAFAIFFLTAWFGDLGSGDVKLGTLIGASFGFPQMLWALIVGGGIGAVVAAILILRYRPARITIPYAPFLCLGAMVALLYNPGLFPA